MSQDEIHIGDKGTQFNITLYDGTSVVDISTSTGRTFEFLSPTGTVTTVTASFVGSGTAGGLTYTTESTTAFPVDGQWKMQAVVTFANSLFHSDILTFNVYPNLS
jgi:hypothetical protein